MGSVLFHVKIVHHIFTITVEVLTIRYFLVLVIMVMVYAINKCIALICFVFKRAFSIPEKLFRTVNCSNCM